MAKDWQIIAIIVAGIYLVSSGALNLGSSAGTSNQPIVVDVKGSCGKTSATLTVNAYDLYAKGTALSSTRHRIFASGSDKGQLSDGSSMTVDPNDDLLIYGGRNSTFGNAGQNFYAQKISQKLDCAGAPSVKAELAAFDTSVGFNYWNEAGTANSAQAMDADTEYTIPIELKASNNQCFGNPSVGKDNIACFKRNTSVTLTVELDKAKKAYQPESLTSKAVSGEGFSCYYFPVICDNNKFKGDVIVKTASTAPGSGVSGNISIFIEDVDYDLNADDKTEIVDVEDEDRNDLGATVQEFGIAVT